MSILFIFSIVWVFGVIYFLIKEYFRDSFNFTLSACNLICDVFVLLTTILSIAEIIRHLLV